MKFKTTLQLPIATVDVVFRDSEVVEYDLDQLAELLVVDVAPLVFVEDIEDEARLDKVIIDLITLDLLPHLTHKLFNHASIYLT